MVTPSIAQISHSGWSNADAKRKHHFLRADRIFLAATVAISLILTGLSIRYSRLLSVNDNQTVSESANDAAVSVRPQNPTNVSILNKHVNSKSDVTMGNSKKYEKDRVYCMIPFIWNKEIYDVIMKTWGRKCDVINFFSDSIVGGQLEGDKITPTEDGYKPYWEYPKDTFPDNVIFINMTRTWNDCEPAVDKKGKEMKKVCRHIWEKMWRSWLYVQEHHLNTAEWFCKVDYDTFFFPDNLKYFVRDQKNWDPYNEYHYFGHWMSHRKAGREPMIVGAAVCWSWKTLKDIADVYRNMPRGYSGGERGKCEDRAKATEEVTTSLCLKQHLNVDAEPARDEQEREYVLPSRFNNMLTWNRKVQGEWWFWKGKPQEVGQGEECCAHRPIGLHKYKLPSQIMQIHQQFYGSPDNEDYKGLTARPKSTCFPHRRFCLKVFNSHNSIDHGWQSQSHHDSAVYDEHDPLNKPQHIARSVHACSNVEMLTIMEQWKGLVILGDHFSFLGTYCLLQ